MRAGRLRHRISIQSVGSTYDDYGDLSNSWSTDAIVWASVSPVSGNQEKIAGELTGVETHRIRIRHRAGVSAHNRVQFGARIFEIVSANNWDERNVYIEILAKEVTT